MISGEVEVNVGPKKKNKGCLSVCQWNLIRISGYGYSKLFLLNSYNLRHKFDIICFSATYLDSNTLLDDDNLKSLVTHLFVLITHLIPKAEVSVSTRKAIYL